MRVEQVQEELSRLVHKGQDVTADELVYFFEKNGEFLSDTEALKKGKMMSDVALLLTLAEQRGVEL